MWECAKKKITRILNSTISYTFSSVRAWLSSSRTLPSDMEVAHALKPKFSGALPLCLSETVIAKLWQKSSESLFSLAGRKAVLTLCHPPTRIMSPRDEGTLRGQILISTAKPDSLACPSMSQNDLHGRNEHCNFIAPRSFCASSNNVFLSSQNRSHISISAHYHDILDNRFRLTFSYLHFQSLGSLHSP